MCPGGLNPRNPSGFAWPDLRTALPPVAAALPAVPGLAKAGVLRGLADGGGVLRRRRHWLGPEFGDHFLIMFHAALKAYFERLGRKKRRCIPRGHLFIWRGAHRAIQRDLSLRFRWR